MPVMDGWEFMKEFEEIKSQLGKKISVYILSASIDAHDIDRARNINSISDYIFKPVDVQQLHEISPVNGRQHEARASMTRGVRFRPVVVRLGARH